MASEFNWAAFLLAVFVIELTPGPNMGWLATLTLREGRAAGLAAVGGIATGLSVQLLAAVTGLTALIVNVPAIHAFLHWAGVAFMLYLAFEALTDTGATSLNSTSGERGFRRGLIANILNPKALAFYVLLISQFIPPNTERVWLYSLFLGSIHVAVATMVHAGIVSLASQLGPRLDQWRTSLTARVTFAGLLAAIAAWIALMPIRG